MPDTATITAARTLLQAWRTELHTSYANVSTGQVDDVDAARDIAELDEVVEALAASQAFELNEHTIAILGRPNFTCRPIADVLRASGVDIPPKSEREQAATIHYLLGFYFTHGADWWSAAHADLDSKIQAALAAAETKA